MNSIKQIEIMQLSRTKLYIWQSSKQIEWYQIELYQNVFVHSSVRSSGYVKT